MHIDRDNVADQLRNQLLDNLHNDGLVEAMRDQFIGIIADSDDPLDHPMTYNGANDRQREALRKIMAGVRDYITASGIDDVAVQRRINLVRELAA